MSSRASSTKKNPQAFIEGYEKLLNSLGDDEAVLFADAVHPTHAARPAGCWAPKQEKLAIGTNERARAHQHSRRDDFETGQTRMIEAQTVDAVSTIRLLQAIEACYPTLARIHVFLDNASYSHARLSAKWPRGLGAGSSCISSHPIARILIRSSGYGSSSVKRHAQQSLRNLRTIRQCDAWFPAGNGAPELGRPLRSRHRQFPRRQPKGISGYEVNGVYLAGTIIFLSLLVIFVIWQIIAKEFHPFLYWATIVASTTLGRTMADFADRSLGIGYTGGSTLLFVSLMAVLAFWYWSERTISVDTVSTPKVEAFYWAAITFSQTLGTALGDWMADTGGLGYEGGALVFGAGLGDTCCAYYWTNISRVTLFWAAFILTRPLGATVGDFLDKPVNHGGLPLEPPPCFGGHRGFYHRVHNSAAAKGRHASGCEAGRN